MRRGDDHAYVTEATEGHQVRVSNSNVVSTTPAPAASEAARHPPPPHFANGDEENENGAAAVELEARASTISATE